jgi:hypothetical protein
MEENSRLMQLIKFMNQGIAAPAVMRLKFFVLSNYNVQYFDCRGQWDIRFTWKDGTGGRRIRVSHIKWEETKPMKFEFCWILSIFVNSDVTEVLNAKLKIKHIRWVVEVTNEEREMVFLAFKDMYNPNKDPYNKLSRNVV